MHLKSTTDRTGNRSRHQCSHRPDFFGAAAMTRGIIPVRLPRVSALVAVVRVVAAAVLFALSAALPATAQPSAPGKPAAPTVSAASVTSLTVMWSAPDDGGSAITDYDVQYRADDSVDWTDGNHDGTATTATLTGLSEDTSYQVQVRATNAEGTGVWSDSGSGKTDANAAPTFSSSATFDAAENQTAAGTVLATDSDDDIECYSISGGADRSFFSIGASSGNLTFDDAPNFEDARDTDMNNTYVVEVQATSGAGGAGEDGHADDHGDGDGCERRGAGQAGRADGGGGLGDEPDRDVDRAGQRGSGDHGLRLPPPDDLAGGHVDGGDRHDDHDAVGDDREPGEEHVV